MFPIDTKNLKRQIEELKTTLALLDEKVDEVSREESARMNAFHGLMGDLRALAGELEFHQHDGQTLPAGGIKGWADKLRAMGDARFKEYLSMRDGAESLCEVALLDDNQIRIFDRQRNYTTITSGSPEMSARMLARCMYCEVTERRSK